MKYECEHAYDMNNIPYILCKKENAPLDKADIYHNLCPHQRMCGEKRCAILTEGWVGCKKRAEQEAPAAAAAVKKTRKKAE